MRSAASTPAPRSMHLHARDPDGRPEWRRAAYEELICEIRRRCPGVVVCATTSGREVRGCRSPGRRPGAARRGAPGHGQPDPRLAELPQRPEHQRDRDGRGARAPDGATRGSGPSSRSFDLGMAHLAHRLLDRGLIAQPLYANLMLGFPNGAPADARSLVALVDALPARQLLGSGGPRRLPAAGERAGDRHRRARAHRPRGQPYLDVVTREARHNQALVERVVAQAAAVSRPVATPGRGARDARPAHASGAPRGRTRVMEIVLATQSLVAFGGSETYAVTVADHLQRLGHDVWLYAADRGPMSEHAEGLGLRVVGERSRLPARPAALIVQDSVVAYEMAAAFAETPQVFVAHSDIFDLSLPPALPGLTALVVTLYDRVDRRVRALAREHGCCASASPWTSRSSSPSRRCATGRRWPSRWATTCTASGWTCCAAPASARGSSCATWAATAPGRPTLRSNCSTTPTSSSARRA